MISIIKLIINWTITHIIIITGGVPGERENANEREEEQKMWSTAPLCVIVQWGNVGAFRLPSDKQSQYVYYPYDTVRVVRSTWGGIVCPFGCID